MAHDVFISHSSKDKPTADAICSALEQNGVRCWIAPRDVRPGNYGAEIIGAIKECAVFLLVFSESSNDSEDVANETNNATKHKKTIIPYRLGNTEMSEEMQYYLSRKHWIAASPGDTAFTALVRAVKDALGMQAQEATPVVADERVYVEKMQFGNGYYTGYMINGECNGQGTYAYFDGDIYEGEFKDHTRSGQGTYYSADGTITQGQWEDNDFIGKKKKRTRKP